MRRGDEPFARPPKKILHRLLKRQRTPLLGGEALPAGAFRIKDTH